MQPVDLEVLTILTCPLPLSIVNGHEGKPHIHRVIQIAKDPGTEAQLWHGSWLDSTGDARREGKGEPEAYVVEVELSFLLSVPSSINRQMRKKMGVRGMQMGEKLGYNYKVTRDTIGLHPLNNIRYGQKK